MMRPRRLSMTGARAGIISGVLAALVAYAAMQIRADLLPATDWMEITELHVDDAMPGEDPRIVYARTFYQDSPGNWAVNVFRYRDDKDVIGTVYCSGSGVATYKAGRELPPAATRLSWLMGREGSPCTFARGTYKAVVTVTVTPPGYPSKIIEKESNYFLVPPR